MSIFIYIFTFRSTFQCRNHYSLLCCQKLLERIFCSCMRSNSIQIAFSLDRWRWNNHSCFQNKLFCWFSLWRKRTAIICTLRVRLPYYIVYYFLSIFYYRLICGLGGSLYIFCKQVYDNWATHNHVIKKIKKTK